MKNCSVLFCQNWKRCWEKKLKQKGSALELNDNQFKKIVQNRINKLKQIALILLFIFLSWFNKQKSEKSEESLQQRLILYQFLLKYNK